MKLPPEQREARNDVLGQPREDEMKKPKIYPDRTAEEVDAAEAQIDASSKRIDFYVTEYTVELLAQKMSRQDFVIPAYSANPPGPRSTSRASLSPC